MLRRTDAEPIAAAVVERYLPVGELWARNGLLFVPPEIGAALGEPTDAMLIGTNAFPAWTLGAATA